MVLHYNTQCCMRALSSITSPTVSAELAGVHIQLVVNYRNSSISPGTSCSRQSAEGRGVARSGGAFVQLMLCCYRHWYLLLLLLLRRQHCSHAVLCGWQYYKQLVRTPQSCTKQQFDNWCCAEILIWVCVLATVEQCETFDEPFWSCAIALLCWHYTVRLK